MCEITNQLIADSKVEPLAAMLKDGISEDSACRYLQIPEEMQAEMLNKARLTLKEN